VDDYKMICKEKHYVGGDDDDDDRYGGSCD
jgi:hypothetical protein